MARLHLAYRSFDREKALYLKKRLEGHGHIVSIDVDFLLPGHEWRKGLDEAFRRADHLVVLLSRKSMDERGAINSPWIAADIGAARFSGKAVLPVLLDDIPFPALIDDIYCYRPPDNSLDEASSALATAIAAHDQATRTREGLHLPTGYEHLAAAVRQFR